MKKLLFTILTTSALTASLFAAQNEKFTGKDNQVTGGAIFSFKPSSILNIPQTVSAPDVYRLLSLGSPITASSVADSLYSGAEKNGAYTIAAVVANAGDVLANGVLTLLVPRNVSIATTVALAGDTPASITITGTDLNGKAMNEVIVVSATVTGASPIVGAKAFKTISGISGLGWVTNGAADTITIGFGNVIGLPVVPFSTVGNILFSGSGSLTITSPVVVKGTAGNIGETTVTVPSSGAALYLQSRW